MQKLIDAHASGHHSVRSTVCSIFKSEFTAYTFSLTIGHQTWRFQKRYSDFQRLDNELTKKYSNRMQRVLKLPPKKYVGNKKSSLICYRQQALGAYLRSILQDTALLQSEEVRNFIEIPLEAALSDLELEVDDTFQFPLELRDSVSPTQASNADTSPGNLRVVMKVQSWEEEAELKWGDVITPQSSFAANNKWSDLVSGELLTPR